MKAERSQFTFYASFFKAIGRIKDDAARAQAYDAICAYALTGVEPDIDALPDIVALLFPMMRSQVDKDELLAQERRKKGCKGELHPNWKGGITPRNQRERHSAAYANWRKTVFSRDAFTCQMCGQHGGELNAHHIKPWAVYTENRFDVSNGVTLCKTCHKKLHRR